jgi:hypothetical protein
MEACTIGSADTIMTKDGAGSKEFMGGQIDPMARSWVAA